MRTVHTLGTVDSTNTWTREGLRTGRLTGAGLVTAERQIAGRGRGANTWDSDNTHGLWATLFYTRCAERPFDLMVRVSLAVTEALRDFGAKAGIKWPNDVVVDKQKICGILAEAFDGNVIAGFGVNLRQVETDFHPDLAVVAVSLRILTGKTISNDVFLECFLRYYDADMDAEARFKRYLGLLAVTGERMRVNERTVRVRGVSRDGGLLVEDQYGKEEKIMSGTLRW
ncbi:MAG: biotin--[acetyl-CoA-carboxylase] ligase [Fibrobacterota bacterium]